MKLQTTKSSFCADDLVHLIGNRLLTPAACEFLIYGTYLECWFRCLKLSKQYNQNCRTGLFGSKEAADTFKLFGFIEDYSFRDWWHETGFTNFGSGLTALKVNMVVVHRAFAGLSIQIDVHDQISDQLAGQEFCFLLQQVRLISGPGCLLSKAPLAWSIYRNRITTQAIMHNLDVFTAYDTVMHIAPRTKLWRIGEQMNLNSKAMTRSGDTPYEQTAKHIVMGHMVSDLVRKGQGLVANACEGVFPRYR